MLEMMRPGARRVLLAVGLSLLAAVTVRAQSRPPPGDGG
jgi:hypothetical protein